MPQIVRIRLGVGSHVGATDGNKTHACRCENRAGIGITNVAFVAKDRGAFRQSGGQFMNRGQILLAGSQEVKTDGNAFWGTNQMQTVATELFPLGGTMATEGFPTHLLATRGPRSFTDGQRHIVDDEGFALSENLTEYVQNPAQPVSQCVQAPVEARHTQPVT